MKKLLASTAVMLSLVGPAFAQDSAGFMNAPAEGDIYASNLMGMRLYVTEKDVTDDMMVTADQMSTDWNDVGEVSDLLVSQEGQIKAVVVDIGGFLGLGEHSVAADMGQLHFLHEQDNPSDIFIAMKGTKDTLEAAPEFDRGDMTEQAAMAPATDADGMAPATDAGAMAPANDADAMAPVNDAGAMAPANDAGAMAPTNDAGAKAPATDAGAMGAAAPNPEPMAADNMAATRWDRPAMQAEGYADVPVEQVTTDTLTGATVYGPDNQSIGEVGDLVVDADGKITEAIVDVGGFLGIGQHSVEVAFDEMQIMQNADGSDVRVNVSATKDQLEGRPEYKS